MPIRMTGMVSGLDTDSIVKELVSAYSTKKEKYEKEQTKLGWKQEIWKSLNLLSLIHISSPRDCS